jgi:hypothetical protein
VISEETYKALDQLRCFRHRERNTYGLVLDAAIVVERAAQTKLAFEQFKSELAAFIGSKNAAEPSEQNSDQAPSD